MKFGDKLSTDCSCHWIFLHTCVPADFVACLEMCQQYAATGASEKLDQMQAELELKLRECDKSCIDGLTLHDGIS